MPWAHDEHHEKNHKNLHNEQCFQQQQEGHEQEGFKMDVGSANKLGVGVVGFGVVLHSRMFKN